MRTGVAIQTSNYDWDNVSFNVTVAYVDCCVNPVSLL